MLLLRYWGAKLAQSVFVLWAAFTLSFFILYGLPSDPVSLMLSQGGASGNLDPEAIAALNREYGFDRPLVLQYVDHLGAFLRGDFGTSIEQGQPVVDIVGRGIGSTTVLALAGFGVAVALGLALAVVASSTRMRWLRQVLQSLPPLALSLPPFWLGLVLLQLFSFTFHWFPSFGDRAPNTLVLPTLTLAIPVSATIAQVLTKNFLTTWQQPFVQVAQAKGLGRPRLLSRHVLRNAVIPALTMAGITFGHLLAGTVITETVFSRAGLGRVTQQAVTQQDLPVVQFVVVLAAAIFVVVNLLVDGLYPVIDPRIRRRGLVAA
ncbi:ABC transporter permease [Galbitalea sp. SE-J8]|uniref:ABC transporter permease n=1 Tax=Galbitalea sp. SE-J8 TaxID=3054952 RepID=UPI00259CF916|nr:ABC transporter permease [Galbitalea sp. SE-J8]MDM4761585.1 ABC transporter permease [Galbitalea sp. SE-J8]